MYTRAGHRLENWGRCIICLPLPSSPQEAAPLLDPKSMPPIIETDDLPRRKLEKQHKIPTAEMIAYLDFNVSTTGVLSGVKVQIELTLIWELEV